MSNSLPINTSAVACGLATQTATVVTAGFYTASFTAFLPYQASGSSNDSSVTTGGSGLQMLVKLNGVTKLTVNSPAPTQPTMSGSIGLSCSAGDVITFVPSSSADADQGANAVKMICNVYQGV